MCKERECQPKADVKRNDEKLSPPDIGSSTLWDQLQASIMTVKKWFWLKEDEPITPVNNSAPIEIEAKFTPVSSLTLTKSMLDLKPDVEHLKLENKMPSELQQQNKLNSTVFGYKTNTKCFNF